MDNLGAAVDLRPSDPGTRKSVMEDWMEVWAEAYGVAAVIADQGGVHSFHE